VGLIRLHVVTGQAQARGLVPGVAAGLAAGVRPVPGAKPVSGAMEDRPDRPERPRLVRADDHGAGPRARDPRGGRAG
jgi:hypothetical protein